MMKKLFQRNSDLFEQKQRKSVILTALNSRFSLLFAFILISSSAVFAFDFGGILVNDSSFQTYKDGDFNIDQKNSVSIWARHNFDKMGANYFACEGIYNFEGDFNQEDDDSKYTNSLDVNLLKINLSKKFDSAKNQPKVNFEAGRFYFSDLSGLIFTQNADGAKLSFQNNYFKISAYGAYTGLLNAINTKIISANPAELLINGKQPAVQDVSKTFIADNTKIYDLAEKYLIADATLSFPYFAANQTVSFEFLGAFRLEDDKYNRMYATLSFDGPIYRSLFYDVSSTFEFLNYKYNDISGSSKTENEVANLSKIGLTYYFKNVSVGINGLYASGNQGELSPFIGFSKNTSTYSLQEFLYTGIAKIGANARFTPLENLFISANCATVFNALSGDNSEKAEEVEYYGFEYAVGITWQVKSDFQLGITGSQFFDKDNSDLAKKTYLNLHAALAF